VDGVVEDPVTLAASIVVGSVPVLLFLAGLVLMDSYKLVPARALTRALLAGVAAAALALLVNRFALAAGLGPLPLKRYLAPLLEETFKLAWIVWLVRSHRTGFMVDAGIQGCAVGAAFALVENVTYALALPSFQPLLWLVRGLGTAIMHGSTTAMAAVMAQDRAERSGAAGLRAFLPGLGLAVVVHAGFNHLTLQPLAATAVLLLSMPLLLLLVFEHSERATRAWLGAGFDSEVELLELITGEGISASRVGRYLESLKSRFAGPVVADMLCLLRIHLELSLRAKGLLLARQTGIRIAIDEGIRENFRELRFLERSVGPTGRLAMQPFLRASRRDLWQLYVLER
jgi:protease PrsW